MTDHKKRVSLIDMFSCPESYKPPDDAGLATSTEYPNQNSREYRKKLVDQSPTCLPFFETADINKAGHFVLGTNNYRGRIWNGWGWGFELAEDLGDATKSAYKFHSNGSITNLKFVEDNIFLMSNAMGQIDLWSTRPMANSTDSSYCLFSIGSSNEHTSIVSSLDVLPGKTKAVSGDKNGSLKVWDMGQADLHSYQTYYGAHSNEITAVTTNGSDESVFGTASRDRSLLIWDHRQPRPAIGLFEEHIAPFTAMYWSTSNETNEQIFAGDITGNIYMIDKRRPDEFVQTKSIFEHKIVRKIRANHSKMAITGDTNIVHVIDMQNLEKIYTNDQAPDFVRDALWYKSSLYTIGWSSHFKEHILS